jgi:hypothetical protein
MMIPTLPQKYRDLILDVTLRAYNGMVPHFNELIWANHRHLALSPGNKWNAARFTPCTTFEVEPLFKCRNLKKLTIKLLPSLYTLAWGSGRRGHRIEEVEAIRELLKIRGLQDLKLVDLGKIPKNFPHLVVTKEKLERLLRTELLKQRQG